MGQLTRKASNQALELLGMRMELDKIDPIELVVCGGSGLIALNLISRPATQDVDVLAVQSGGRLISADPFPASFREAVRSVGRDLRLPDEWLNSGPTRLLDAGLPTGLENRLVKHVFGERLVVKYISRIDQVFLKVYAATDSGHGRHLNDLLELEPNADELLAAVRWVRTQDPSDGFFEMICSMLKAIGHSDVIETI